MHFDVSPFASEVARIILLRSGIIRPILWKQDPHRGAKKVLDGIDDSKLLGVAQLADKQMAAAVRALLYLWNGWAGECQILSRAAGPLEAAYLSALSAIHQSQFDEAKTLFTGAQSHPVFETLAVRAAQVTKAASEPALQRLNQMLVMDKRWEPFLYTDAIAQAASGQFELAGEAVVRQLQVCEFELLLIYCHEKATGRPCSGRGRMDPAEAEKRAAERERRIREEKKLREERRQRESSARSESSASGVAASQGGRPGGLLPAGEDRIMVSCPKCRTNGKVFVSLRGKQTSCQSCGTSFLVPAGKGGVASISAMPRSAAGSVAAKSDVVKVLCPKCGKGLALSSSARGKRTTCDHCSAAFMVPGGPTVGARR